MQAPSFSCRIQTVALIAAMSLSVVACDSSRMLSGVFRSEDTVCLDGDGDCSDGCWVELMLAQFGPDVTGIVRVFGEDQFIVPARDMCPCRYVETGSVVDKDLGFAFRTHRDCPGSVDTPLVIGSFTYFDPDTMPGQNSDDYLTGTLVLEGGDRTTAQTVVLRRVKIWSEVSEDDLTCEDPIVHDDPGSSALSAGDGAP